MNKTAQKGSISMLMVVMVIAFSAIILMQIPQALNNLNFTASYKKDIILDKLHLNNLARMIKAKHDLYKLDPTCTSVSAITHNPKVVNGLGICMPVGDFCSSSLTNNTSLNPMLTQCIRTDSNSLDWQKITNTPVPPSKVAKGNNYILGSSSTQFNFANKAVSINIPLQTDTSVWRECASVAGCVKLSLCPLGKTSCSQNQVETEIVVKLDNL